MVMTYNLTPRKCLAYLGQSRHSSNISVRMSSIRKLSATLTYTNGPHD